MKRLNTKAFTLIELLIVVAIIAILAAIAVPNFLEAQMRARVSRAQSDLRTLATAIESYVVDHNLPPREYSTFTYGDPLINGQNASGIIFPGRVEPGNVQHGLSTPVSYLTSAWLFDPFVQRGSNIDEDQQRYTYHNLYARATAPFTIFGSDASQEITRREHLDFFGNWRVASIGPDRDYFNNLENPGSRAGVALRENIIYDPTNGTVSEGNIWRSQKRSESDQPEVKPGLLGAH